MNARALPEAPFPLVLIEWEDSAQPRPAWEWVDNYELENAISCVSVGYLVAQSPNALAIAPNLGDRECPRAQASGIFRIPRSAVRRIREIRACRPFEALCDEAQTRQVR
jgi:hypothetical protein